MCLAFVQALREYGVPEEVLTDNGKQFTGRFTRPRPGEVLFERICRENGIVARNTKPRSPTTTGKVERFHQTLQRELLDHVQVWPDVETAQAAIEAFRAEYNSNRPHQSLQMAFPSDRFVPRPRQDRLPLHLPATLGELTAASSPSSQTETVTAGPVSVPEPPVSSMPGVEQMGLAVEVTRIVPASGNLALRRQQFWLGPARAGVPVRFWADTTVVHLLIDGVRLKTVPSRLTPADLGQLLTEGAQPAGAPPVATGPVTSGGPVEVERLVNACGLIGLAGRQHPVGIQYAGRRVTVRIDQGVLQLATDGVLLRSLPNSLTVAEIARIRDARPAGPPPVPAAGPIRFNAACPVEVRWSLPDNASTSESPTPDAPWTSKPPTTPCAPTTTPESSSRRPRARRRRASPGSRSVSPNSHEEAPRAPDGLGKCSLERRTAPTGEILRW